MADLVYHDTDIWQIITFSIISYISNIFTKLKRHAVHRSILFDVTHWIDIT